MGWDARVVMEIANGAVGNARVSSPQTERKFLDDIRSEVNRLIKDAGVRLAESLEIEIDDSGKIRATNLAEGAPESERVLALLDRLNGEVERADVSEGGKNGEKSGAKDRPTGWDDGVRAIAENLARYLKIRDGIGA